MGFCFHRVISNDRYQVRHRFISLYFFVHFHFLFLYGGGGGGVNFLKKFQRFLFSTSSLPYPVDRVDDRPIRFSSSSPYATKKKILKKENGILPTSFSLVPAEILNHNHNSNRKARDLLIGVSSVRPLSIKLRVFFLFNSWTEYEKRRHNFNNNGRPRRGARFAFF